MLARAPIIGPGKPLLRYLRVDAPNCAETMNDEQIQKELQEFEAECARKRELIMSRSPKRPAPQDSPSKKTKTERSYVCNLCEKPKPNLGDTGNLQDHICIQHIKLDDETFYNAMKKSIRRSLQHKWQKRESTIGVYKCPECDYYRNEQRQIRVHATNLHLDSMTPNEFKALMKKVERMRSKSKSSDDVSPKALDDEAEALRASLVTAVRDAFRARDEAYKNLKASYASEIVDLSLAVVTAPTTGVLKFSSASLIFAPSALFACLIAAAIR